MFGKPEEGEDLAEFILSQIENKDIINKAIVNAADAIVEIMTNGIDAAMNEFNK